MTTKKQSKTEDLNVIIVSYIKWENERNERNEVLGVQ